MSNSIEDFIEDNRESFDDKMPSEYAWSKIEASLKEKKSKKTIVSPLFTRAIAAAAVLIVMLVVYFNLVKQSPKQESIAGNKNELNNLPPEYAPQVIQFAKLIDRKQEELKSLAKEQPKLYIKFSSAISQLDSSYNILKSLFNASPNKEILIEAMIQNLQLQLNVLNQQLNIIKQIKQSKEYSHETNFQNI